MEIACAKALGNELDEKQEREQNEELMCHGRVCAGPWGHCQD